MNSKIIWMLLAPAVLLIGFFVLSEPSNSTKSLDSRNDEAKTSEDVGQELIIGETSARAVIVEYADFKCPSCGAFHQEAGRELRANYVQENKLKIVFRPMNVIGPDSGRAAVGAYCATDQSKFVEYHDAVFDFMWENYYKAQNYQAEFEDVLTESVLSDISRGIELDVASFKNCLNDDSKLAQVNSNEVSAQNAGVRGTPSFVVNGEVIAGPQPYQVFKSLVDLQL